MRKTELEKLTISIPISEAQKAYEDYFEKVKERKEKYLKDLKQVYYQLSKGKKVIDIFQVFRQTGVNRNGDPLLAISLASETEVKFRKNEGGAGTFQNATTEGTVADVQLPTHTFPEWEFEWEEGEKDKNIWRAINRNLETKAPIVPAHLLPSGKLDNYYILFEVKEWNRTPVIKDPFLLKRINLNAFIVLAEWDLSPIELAISRGLKAEDKK
jgi:hypothetical protein